ncbi:hypothetical protein Tco_0624910 [Tanacetum coccineum]|uniref:Uncharacterized protein n=1 Tax=Tanacetum coccineum TaxID=301880 RepID=A0ABQ4WFC9_9ASTR
MHIDELHKFSDSTLNDVRYALDDILKRIRMECLPQTVWRNIDRERAGAMIQAIDQQLRNRRLMRSLEKFVGGRLDYKHFYQLSHSKLVGIEKVAVCSSLQSLKPKCTIESRAKRDHP